jgi:hypothetical protein
MKILMVRWRSGGRGLRLSRFAWRLPARQLGCFLLTVSLAGIAFAQGSPVVVERDGRVISLEPYAANIVRITMSIDKSAATGAPGYGFLAKPSDREWTHERDDAGNDVFRSSRMVLRVSPGDLPADKLPQPMPLDALNRQLREPYFGGGGAQGPYNDALLVTTSAGKTLLHMRCGYRKLRPSWKRENLVCMPTLSAGETDRGNHSAAIQRRSESQSGECKEQSGVSSRRECFGS